MLCRMHMTAGFGAVCRGRLAWQAPSPLAHVALPAAA
jgi:hypothetical protein